MAIYRHAQYLNTSSDEVFNGTQKSGATPPMSGIYRCEGCGREVVAEHNRQLPPQNHHQHTLAQGDVLWRLIVFADHRPK